MDAWVITDEEARFVADAEIVGIVYGNTHGLVVVPLDASTEDTAAFVALVRARGYQYCGLMTYHDGQIATKCAPSPEAVLVMANAAWKFASLVKDRMDAKKQHSADWLTRLHLLPDPRD